uniref:Uncharacterized protein n=1 Tax=Glossina brevipalpis TaxID=37001 RepID=A0A1A9WR01_9MUSC
MTKSTKRGRNCLKSPTTTKWYKYWCLAAKDTFDEYIANTKVSGVWLLRHQHKWGCSRKLPINTSLQEVAEGFEFLNLFTDQTWLPPNNTAYKITDDILRLNNITISEAAIQVSAGCNDFVKRCFWDGDEFPCHQNHEYLSFIPTTSYLGSCCSFNYNLRNLSYNPFSANSFGINSGLSLIGVEGLEHNLSAGLIILVHHPMDFVTEAAASVTITSNSESFIQILPTVHSVSPEVLKLAQNKRDCSTSNDLGLSNYRKAACSLSCRRDFIIEKCHCQSYHLATEASDHRECKLNDSLCYMDNYADLGGVFNLCLGLNLISLVEFFYYIIYRFKLNLNARIILIDT